MNDRFLKCWFEGFERSIKSLDDETRKNIFKECGKSCSDSYSRQIYMDEYQSSQTLDDFLDRLNYKFPEAQFQIIEDDVIELTYSFCACDLVKIEYITTPLLCECSRQSLLYNWGSVLGQDKVTVQLQQSILEGHYCCRFMIHLARNPFGK